jgi:hypothetical protein
MFLPQVDARMREPVSEQFQILVLHMCVAYVDGLQYCTVCYIAAVIRQAVCSEHQTGHRDLERRELWLYEEHILVNNYNN